MHCTVRVDPAVVKASPKKCILIFFADFKASEEPVHCLSYFCHVVSFIIAVLCCRFNRSFVLDKYNLQDYMKKVKAKIENIFGTNFHI